MRSGRGRCGVCANGGAASSLASENGGRGRCRQPCGHPGATCTPRSPDLGSWGSARRHPGPCAGVALGTPRGRAGVGPGARLHLRVDETLNLPSLERNSMEIEPMVRVSLFMGYLVIFSNLRKTVVWLKCT